MHRDISDLYDGTLANLSEMYKIQRVDLSFSLEQFSVAQ